MSDKAHEWTDRQIDELAKRFEDVYRQAEREMREKLERSLADYAKENAQRLKALDNTPGAKKAYDDWKQAQVANQAWMQDMLQTLSESAHNANKHAMDMINDALPHVYSENANMSAFALDEQLGYDTGFTLVNEDAVRHLMGLPVQDVGYDQLIREVTWTPEPARSHVQDLRKREVDYPRDMRWNRQKFNSAIAQGILQGESIPNIVKRTKSIYGMNKNSAIRAARTATTNAENAGRMSTFERAQRLGIDMEIEWLATLDGRTRDSHRELDGERIQLGETFSNGLRWPGDPLGSPDQVWNCRCRGNGRVVGFDGKRGDWADERGKRWTRLPKGMTYEDWRKAKAVSREESYKNPSKVRDEFWPIGVKSKSGFTVDSLHPQTLGGVERTKEYMTFDEANKLRGNPNYNVAESAYQKYIDAKKAYTTEWNRQLNNGGRFDLDVLDRLQRERDEAERAYNKSGREQNGYRTNCQTCVVANEARRRGYDVEATPNTRGSVNEQVSRQTNLAWIDGATGEHPEYITYQGDGRVDSRGNTIPTHKRFMQWLESDGVIDEGERYTIEFWWKGRSKGGHIVSIERTEQGLRMYDPQCGETYTGNAVSEYLKKVKYSTTTRGTTYADGPMLLKVSGYEFDLETCNQILRSAE